MKEDLLRFKRNQKYMVADAETEGLNLLKSRPWQFAWILTHGQTIIKRENRFIYWEDLNISDDAARITGFDKRYFDEIGRASKKYRVRGEIVEAEDPKQVWKDFEKTLYDPSYVVIGQNFLGFDVYMINVWRKLMGLQPDYSFLSRVRDTKSFAAAIFKNILADRENLTAWQYKMLNIKEKGLKTSQAFLLKHYAIPHDPELLHDGLYDIEMTFLIFLKQIYDLEV